MTTDDIVAFIVHRTDSLKQELHLTDPFVRFYVVEKTAGKILQTENGSPLGPICTKKGDLRTVPDYSLRLDEQLSIPEKLSRLLREDVIVLIEIVQMVEPRNIIPKQAGTPAAEQKPEERTITWGFLSLISKSGPPNLGTKLRVQLFKLPKRFRHKHKSKLKNIFKSPEEEKDASVAPTFQYYKDPYRKAYPSTLYITIKGSANPTSQELEASQSQMALTQTGTAMSTVKEGTSVAGRVPSNAVSLRQQLEGGQRGCFMMKFSNDGRFLACACGDLILFHIKVFDAVTGKCLHVFSGHHDLVYDVSWSADDTEIVTASSDGTAKVWNCAGISPDNQEFNPNTLTSLRLDSAQAGQAPTSPPVRKKKKGIRSQSRIVLQHTCFVYSARFHPSMPFIATASFDQSIRLWGCEKGEMVTQLTGHKSTVNCLLFENVLANLTLLISQLGNRSKLLSGDGQGVIKIWSRKLEETSKGIDFECLATVSQFQGSPINNLTLHPTGKSVFVHLRGTGVSCMDIRFYTVKKEYSGFQNKEWPIKGDVSRDGKHFLCGSEDAQLLVWETESGNIKNTITGSTLGLTDPITCTCWNPKADILAACSFGTLQQIVLFTVEQLIAPDPFVLSSMSEMGTASTMMTQSMMSQSMMGYSLNAQTLSSQMSEMSMMSTMKSTRELPPLNVPPGTLGYRTSDILQRLASLPSPPPVPASATTAPPTPLFPQPISTPTTPSRPPPFSADSFLLHQSDEVPEEKFRSSKFGYETPQKGFIDGSSEEEFRRQQEQYRKARREAALTKLHNYRKKNFGESLPRASSPRSSSFDDTQEMKVESPRSEGPMTPRQQLTRQLKSTFRSSSPNVEFDE